jgi:hypothetical protein
MATYMGVIQFLYLVFGNGRIKLKQITKLLIDDFNINKLGYDFMGFSLQRGDIYTFHHLIVPARKGGAMAKWNGAVLCGKTSHEYLHRIENINREIFELITNEMVDMKIKQFLDPYNLKQIGDLLSYFENEYSWLKTRNGNDLIKEEYRRRNKF